MSPVTLVHPFTNFPMIFRVVAPPPEGADPAMVGVVIQEVEINWTPQGLGWRTVSKDAEGIAKTFPESATAIRTEDAGSGSGEGQPPA